MLRERIGNFLVQFLPEEYISEAPKIDLKAVNIKKIGLTYSKNSKAGSYSWETPEGFDFAELEKAYLTDSYIRQALDKYSDFMFKAGWDLIGKNQKSVDYIRSRLRAMSLSTQKPIEELFGTIADELIKYHNVFIVKAWSSGNYKYPGNIKVSPGLYNKSIAGYYILPTGSINIARDINGKVLKYQQTVAGQTAIEFNPEDIIHIAIDQQPGRGFGFPPLAQVIDDVKILRQLEELVHKMVFKHINPLVIYTIGLPQPGLTATDEEIIEAANKMNDLLMDGGLVIPERHKLETLKINTINVKEYLTYFENRVFTGLSMSSTTMGRGDQANKSTSDNLDQMFKDKVKAYQRINSLYLDQFIITELLFEGGFDPITKPEDMVNFKFKEIDLNAKIAEENHMTQMFAMNAITHEELRAGIGRDPVTDEGRLYFNMVTATLAQQASTIAAGNNKDQPANQSGKALAPKASLEEPIIKESLSEDKIIKHYRSLESDIKKILKSDKTQKDKDSSIRMICGLSKIAIEKSLFKEVHKTYNEAYNACFVDSGNSFIKNNGEEKIQTLTNEGNILLSKFNKEISNSILSIITDTENLLKTDAIFESREYKIKRIVKQQVNSAYNQGYLEAAEKLEINILNISCQEDSCQTCKEYSSLPIDIRDGLIPPHHINCGCRLYLRSETNV